MNVSLPRSDIRYSARGVLPVYVGMSLNALPKVSSKPSIRLQSFTVRMRMSIGMCASRTQILRPHGALQRRLVFSGLNIQCQLGFDIQTCEHEFNLGRIPA